MKVRFGTDDLKHLGFTDDVSYEGMFIEARTVYKVGVNLQISLETRDDQHALMDGVVQWAKKAPAQFAHKMKSGMGVLITRFQEGEELFHSFCPREVCINCTPLPDDESTST